MKTVKLKEALETLEKLKDGYEDLRLLIADQVRDDEITEAAENFKKLQELKAAIEQMEELDVCLE